MKHIETLIQRYLEGKTSVAEEHELRMFFMSADVPDELKKYAPLFNWQDEACGFGDDLDDIFAKSASEIEPVPTIKRPMMRRMAWWSVAACVAVVASVALFLNRPDTDTKVVHPIAQRSVSKPARADSATPPCDKSKTPVAQPTATMRAHTTTVKAASAAIPATNSQSIEETGDTYSDPQVAYEEAQKALMLLSDNLTKGIEAIENANLSNS